MDPESITPDTQPLSLEEKLADVSSFNAINIRYRIEHYRLFAPEGMEVDEDAVIAAYFNALEQKSDDVS
jgi:hypothetical protein